MAGWSEVTDPQVLKALGFDQQSASGNGYAPAAPAPAQGGGQGWTEVTDPKVLRSLGFDQEQAPESSAGRTAGLTARGVVQAVPSAVAGLPAMLYDAGRDAVQGLRYGGQRAAYAMGVPGVSEPNIETFFPGRSLHPTSEALGQLGKAGADVVGLPEPATAGERAYVSAVEGAGSAAGGAGLARVAGKVAMPVSRGIGQALEAMGTGIPSQAIGGAASGATGQALTDSGSTPGQALIGSTLAGLAAGGSAQAARGVYNAGKAAIEPLTQAGRDQTVGLWLRAMANNPDKAINEIETLYRQHPTGSAIPDVAPTLGGASLDEGLSGVERGLRNINTESGGRYAERILDNNRARQNYLDNTVPNEAEIQAMTDVRQRQGDLLRQDAFRGSPQVDVNPIMHEFGRIATSPEYERAAVRNLVDTLGPRFRDGMSAEQLYQIRSDIGNLMDQGRKYGNLDYSDIRLARKQLSDIKDVIDQQLNRATNGKFGTYVNDYRTRSVGIDQAQTLKDVRETAKTSLQPDVASGRDILGAASMRRAMDNHADQIARLEPFQRQALDTILADLQRANVPNTIGIRPAGSDTMRNLSVAHALGRAFGSNVMDNSTLRGLSKYVYRLYSIGGVENKLADMIVSAALDPQQAAMLMKKATPRNIQSFTDRLMASTARTSAGALAGQNAYE